MVAVGGDGTLNEVISGIQTLKTPPAVGYLPQGSTNDFAASLEIPSDPVQAAEAIVRGQRRQLDIGRFGERIFVYVASFGAFTRTSYTASQDVKNALGHFGYLLESLRDLDTLRPYKAVSYTHLDVYKRQVHIHIGLPHAGEIHPGKAHDAHDPGAAHCLDPGIRKFQKGKQSRHAAVDRPAL